MVNLSEIMTIVKPIAQQTSDLLMGYYGNSEALTITHKGEGEGDVTSADLAANELILTRLESAFGTEQFAYITEESVERPERLGYEWVWIVDPLDGTKGFIEKSGEFAVHIALAYRQRPVLGVVAIPAMAQLFWAVAGGGAFLDQGGRTVPIKVSEQAMLAEMTAVISRSHRSEGMAFLLDRLPKRAETNVGGLGGKWMAIATGIADYYIMIPAKSAPKDWDFCAPEIILTEAGGCATHFDGSPILYNRPSLCQSEAIVASNGHAHSELAGLCQSHWEAFQLQSTR